MYRVRHWSVRHARWLNRLYQVFETLLACLMPLLRRMDVKRLDRSLAVIEKPVKKFLFDSQNCGQCTLGSTGMACPMNCPKSLRNGPCGGVRSNGNCEIKPEMICVWVSAWAGSQRIAEGGQAIQLIQEPVDARLRGRSSWLHAVQKRLGETNDVV